MKICKECNLEKNESEYYVIKKNNKLHSKCKDCQKQDQKQYRILNKEKLSEKAKEKRINNKEKYLEKDKNYRKNNPEKIKESCKRYKDNNPEKVAESCKRYKKNNSEKVAKAQKEYRLKNKEKIKELKYKYCHSEKGIADRKAYSKTLPFRYYKYKKGAKRRNIEFNLTKEEFSLFWNKPCSYCGFEIEGIGIDRVNSKLGYELNNCIPCCTTCNKMKLDSTLSEWFNQMKKILTFSKVKLGNI